jgi:hypothetical protein
VSGGELWLEADEGCKQDSLGRWFGVQRSEFAVKREMQRPGEQRSKLKAQGSRLKAQGSRLKAQGSRLKAQGSRLKAQGSRLKP